MVRVFHSVALLVLAVVDALEVVLQDEVKFYTVFESQGALLRHWGQACAERSVVELDAEQTLELSVVLPHFAGVVVADGELL